MTVTEQQTSASSVRPTAFGICHSRLKGLHGVKFGQDGDLPVQGDYNGDGRADVAVYRSSTSYWYIDDPAIDYYFFKWGLADDIPVPADYDGDTVMDISVFRPDGGIWFIRNSTTGRFTITVSVRMATLRHRMLYIR